MTASPPAAISEPRRGAGLTMGTVVHIVRMRLWAFLAALVLSCALVITWAFIATPVYKVAIKVMPRQGEGPGGGLQALLGQFGGLASLAGLSLGGPVDEQQAIAWLKSRALFELFARKEDLLPILFAREWNLQTRQWRAALKRVPTMDDAWLMFDRQIRHVNQDSKTRLVTVEIAWRDRQRAAQWANELVALANEELRQRALREAEMSLTSLQTQLQQADAIELRQSIYRLMEVQVNRKVLAKSRPDYALEVLDPAVVPDADKYSSPKRGLMVLVSLPFGIFVASCAVVALQLASELFGKRRRVLLQS